MKGAEKIPTQELHCQDCACTYSTSCTCTVQNAWGQTHKRTHTQCDLPAFNLMFVFFNPLLTAYVEGTDAQTQIERANFFFFFGGAGPGGGGGAGPGRGLEIGMDLKISFEEREMVLRVCILPAGVFLRFLWSCSSRQPPCLLCSTIVSWQAGRN